MNLTDVLCAIISLASVIITTFLIPLLRAKLSDASLARLKDWTSVAVSAAEQLYGSASGAKKKAFVLTFLEKRGFRVDSDAVNAAIENAVRRLKGSEETA